MFRAITVQFEPITEWPGKPTRRPIRSRFNSTWTATCNLLERELLHLGCQRVVIQLYLDRSELRNDGMPRASARPDRPGVIVSFQSRHGVLRYPCDTFDFWQDNVRAIALSLESLRSVDRYGVTKRAEQYTGWQALPPPNGDHWDATAAKKFLQTLMGGTVNCASDSEIEQLLRAAERKTHPDLGGNPEDFKKVQRCRELLL